MIDHPAGILCALLLIEALVLYFYEDPKLGRFFRFPPALFWIYFLPMLASNLEILPCELRLYEDITHALLPAGIILLLVSSDLPAVIRLGKPSLLMMTAAILGIMGEFPLWFFFSNHGFRRTHGRGSARFRPPGSGVVPI